MDTLETKLQELQSRHDTIVEENFQFQVQSESNTRNTQREWERQDVLRQTELEKLHHKLDKTTQKALESMSKLKLCQEQLTQKEDSYNKLLEEPDMTTHSLQTKLTSGQKLLSKLKAELGKKNTELQEMEGKLAAMASTLKEKQALVKTLETQLLSADKDLSIAMRKLEFVGKCVFTRNKTGGILFPDPNRD